MDAATLALLVVVLVLAGIVKGTIGFGLPLVAVSILTQFLPKEWALALMILPVAFSNLFLGFEGRLFGPSLRRFWPVILAVACGILLGAMGLAALPQEHFLLVVGLVVIGFALAEQFRLVLPVPAAHERLVGIAAGLFGGLLGGVSTAYGPPLIMYLSALRLPKVEFIAAIGAIWTFASLTLILAFNLSGILVGERLWWSLAACVPVGLGLWLGSRVRDRIPQEPFRRLVRLALLLLGANLVRRGLW
jgi:uncharacterized membrane protein YfcA